VRELSSPRVDQSARCPVRELAVHELAYPRVVQLPMSASSFRECGVNEVSIHGEHTAGRMVRIRLGEVLG